MFDNQPQNQNSPEDNQPRPPQVEDIFSKTDSAGLGQVLGPSQPGQVGQKPLTPLPEQNYDDIFGGKKISFKKIFLIFLMLVILAGVVFGGWWAFDYFTKLNKTTTPANDSQSKETDQDIDAITPAEQADDSKSNATSSEQAPATSSSAKDSDSDGLSDSEESDLGTDPEKSDSDGDGLTDKAEIQIYQTDPLNPDSDSDGYSDGREVTNGYDPARSGDARLYDIPESNN